MICRLRIRKPALRIRSCGVDPRREWRATLRWGLLSFKQREVLSKYLCGRLKKELLCRSDFTRLGLRS